MAKVQHETVTELTQKVKSYGEITEEVAILGEKGGKENQAGAALLPDTKEQYGREFWIMQLDREKKNLVQADIAIAQWSFASYYAGRYSSVPQTEEDLFLFGSL